MKKVDILTGIPHYDFDVVKPIFTIGNSVTDEDKAKSAGVALAGAFGIKAGGVQANPQVGFANALQNLKSECLRLGGDAVVGVQFQQRIAMGAGIGTSIQAPEIWAFGTVIKYCTPVKDSSGQGEE